MEYVIKIVGDKVKVKLNWKEFNFIKTNKLQKKKQKTNQNICN